MQIMIASEIELCKRRQVFKTRDALTTRKKILYRNSENIKKEKKNLSPDEQIKMNDFLLWGGWGSLYSLS